MRKKPRHLLPIAEILPQALKKWGADDRVIVSSLALKWPDIVGSPLARKTYPLSLERGLLRIAVEGSSLANELQFLQNDILKKIRHEFPKLEMTQIRFQIVTRSSGLIG